MQHWQPTLPDHYLKASPDQLAASITARRRELGRRLVILGHHYQTDEVIRHADFTGDSLKLSQLAAERVKAQGAEYVVFCGVHFMAESADLLTPEGTSVVLPDLSAGCSMADMAQYDDALQAWDDLHAALKRGGFKGRVIPITYINSSAAIKAFVGKHGGICCTSSNAAEVFRWAMAGGTEAPPSDAHMPKPGRGSSGKAAKNKGKHGDIKVLFLPDQHLGRNTAVRYGLDADKDTTLYDPRLARRGEPLGGTTPEALKRSRVILWAGHCSVHKLFRPEHCRQVRDLHPGATILVHPECCKEVVDLSDLSGSTEFIIRTIHEAPPGSTWFVGTEIHLVNRLAAAAAARGVTVRILSDCQCLCTTMYRIDQPHLAWALDNLAQGKVVNRVSVHADARAPALDALNRMLSLSNRPAEEAA